MPEHEARARAVYDHDKEEPRPSGRRRRQVADWGVGEELFDGMPGRRFERRPHRETVRDEAPRGETPHHEASRADVSRRTIIIETAEGDLPVQPVGSAEDEEFASREEALRAREADDELWAGDEPFADERAGDPADVATETAEFVAVDFPAEPTASPDKEGLVRGGVEGRRTVKIGGRPAEFYGPPARARQRPPRSVHERLGPRPERIAAWAFALGILLILIAIATSHA
jgi:hypothetical protein